MKKSTGMFSGSAPGNRVEWEQPQTTSLVEKGKVLDREISSLTLIHIKELQYNKLAHILGCSSKFSFLRKTWETCCDEKTPCGFWWR